MPFVPAANTLQAELRYNYGSSLAENVLYFQGSAGVTVALATTLGNNLIGWWNTNFKARMPTQVVLREVYVTDLTTQTSFTVSVTTGLPSAGTALQDPLPFNCALCVSLRTANRGRSGRGRNYVLGLLETEVSANTVASTTVSPTLTAYNLLVGAGTFTPGLQLVIVSRFTNKLPRANALVQPVTNAVILDSVVDSQRRRLPGRGR